MTRACRTLQFLVATAMLSAASPEFAEPVAHAIRNQGARHETQAMPTN
jgi:hypothetical protein